MANKNGENVVGIRALYSDDEIKVLRKVAKGKGVKVADLVKELADEAIAQHTNDGSWDEYLKAPTKADETEEESETE